MASPPESNAFFSSAAAYDQFMGRYARPLAREFVKTIPLKHGDRVLDIGCGPGALTAELVAAVGADHVSVIDPSPPFLAYCAGQYPGITAEIGQAEHIPFADASFDAIFSQLVIHFIRDLPQAGREIMRVVKPGGSVAVCTWIVPRMQMITLISRAADAAGIPVETNRVEEFNEDGSVARYLESIGLQQVKESTISVASIYTDFEELWGTYLLAIGPMGPWMSAQSPDVHQAIKASMRTLLDEPSGTVTLRGEARVGIGVSPV